MVSRLKLQNKLEEVIGSDHVYFQPPENVKMKYPCFVYEQYSTFNPHADDNTYLYVPGYQVTLIDPNPDSYLKEKVIAEFPMCRWSRHFVSDNLNHDVFIIYY
jgi:hypothetical protein